MLKSAIALGSLVYSSWSLTGQTAPHHPSLPQHAPPSKAKIVQVAAPARAPLRPRPSALNSKNKFPKKGNSKKEPGLALAYKQSRASWHSAPSGAPISRDERGIPKLVLFAINTHERLELTPGSISGGFSAHDLFLASDLLRDPRTGNKHPVEPRILDTIYHLQVHFHAPEIRVISGYRTPKPNNHSNHGKGRAVDFVVPGVKDSDLAQYARTLGYHGVGIYPVSGFVHVDVREHSYFWVDSSYPGKKNRERGILSDVALASDREAMKRGEKPVPPYVLGSDVDRGKPSVSEEPQDEDTEQENDDESESEGESE